MRARVVTPLLLVAALAAGCGSEEETPRALPSLAVSVTPAPSPTAAPVPTEAQAETPQGAAAFARFWYDQIRVAFDQGDPAPLAAISAPDCVACQAYIASVEQLRDENERAVFNIDVVAAEAPALDETGQAMVTVIYSSDGSIRYSSTGEVIAQEPARTNAEQTLTLIRSAGGWQVQEVLAG